MIKQKHPLLCSDFIEYPLGTRYCAKYEINIRVLRLE